METRQVVRKNKPQKMPLYFMRHAESRFNAGFPDERDAGLSDNGKKQAATITGKVALVITSPLLRARQTLQFSQLQYDDHKISPLCRERKNIALCDYLEGEDKEAETDDAFRARILQFLDELRLLDSKHQDILIISHGIFLCSLLGLREMHNCEFKIAEFGKPPLLLKS